MIKIIIVGKYESGIIIRSRTEKGLYNKGRLKSHKKCRLDLVRDLLFADDCALAACSEEEIQQLTTCFATAAKRFGLTISLKKTEAMLQHRPGTQTDTEPNVQIDGTKLNSVSKFPYLGSIMASNSTLDDEISTRIAKASASFGSLLKRLWLNRDIRLDTKIAVYRAVILTTLLYGSESWTLYRRHIKRLDHFHLKCLRRIARITWQQKIPNTTVLEKCKMQGIEAHLHKSKLRWAGHVSRMNDDRIPKILLYGTIHDQGTTTRGRPALRFKDSLKSSLRACQIRQENWEIAASDRNKWRSQIHSGTHVFETNRINTAIEKRTLRKASLPPD